MKCYPWKNWAKKRKEIFIKKDGKIGFFIRKKCLYGYLLSLGSILFLILIFLNMIMDSSKNGRWIMPFKKFSRLRGKFYYSLEWSLNHSSALLALVCDIFLIIIIQEPLMQVSMTQQSRNRSIYYLKGIDFSFINTTVLDILYNSKTKK